MRKIRPSPAPVKRSAEIPAIRWTQLQELIQAFQGFRIKRRRRKPYIRWVTKSALMQALIRIQVNPCLRRKPRTRLHEICVHLIAKKLKLRCRPPSHPRIGFRAFRVFCTVARKSFGTVAIDMKIVGCLRRIPNFPSSVLLRCKRHFPAGKAGSNDMCSRCPT